MLKVKNLVKIYKIGKTKETVKALNNVSIDFPDTGLVFLLGKSGSGKSTLLNAIGGLDSFDSGEIIIKGKSSKDFSQADFDSYRNTFIGFIFQEYNILEEFTVAKNLSIALELQGKKADKEEVNKLLEQVDMLEYAKRKPNQLSGGQKQRVAIARALIKNPEIIMADEPTGALDSNTGKQVMDTLKKLSKEKLVIIVSHDREFAEIYGDRIVELKDGKIIQDVSKKEIEPTKTASGVSLIDDKIIHIKKGIELTNDDIAKITTVLKNQTSKSDVIISIDDDANEQVKKANFITDSGNKESFCPTTPEDVAQKNYDPNKFKLIKSQLKFKDSFKMGASALKNKVGKLVFTIILSFLSFAMFGLVDTLAAFNRPNAVYTTIEMTNAKHVSLKKESKGEWSNITNPLKDSDAQKLEEQFPGVFIQPVVNRGMYFGNGYNSNNMKLYIKDLDSSSDHPAYEPLFSGMIDISQEKLTQLGFDKIGDLPVDNDPDGYTQVCISKHLYNCYKENNEEITDEQDFLTNHNICNLTKDGDSGNYRYKIVGIIDNHEDLSEFYNIEEEQFQTMNSYMLQQKIRATLDYGYSGMVYTTTSHYRSFLDKALNVNGYIPMADGGSRSVELKYFQYYNNAKDQYYKNIGPWEYEYFNNNFTIKNNLPAYTESGEYKLADDEIILSTEWLYEVNNDSNYSSLIENGLVLKLRESNDSSAAVLKTLKVVGYTQHYGLFVNENLKTELNGSSYYLFTQGEKSLYNSFSKANIYTIRDRFMDSNPFYSNIYYYNGTRYESQYNGDVNLTGNQIIVPYDFVLTNWSSSTMEDLIDDAVERIQNGFTITIKEDWDEDSKDICTFEVVGISSSSDRIFISEEYYNSIIKTRITGYDYAIATLSDDESTNKAFIKACENFNDEGYKFTVQNGATSILDNYGSLFEDLTSVLVWVALGFAVFASLMLMSFISTSISYKKREIGILRALGARGSDVFGIFFIESLIIALINFVLAFITTLVGAFFINRAIIIELGIDLAILTVTIRQFALILGISVLAAFLASILPVSKISRKKPVDAINNR